GRRGAAHRSRVPARDRQPRHDRSQSDAARLHDRRQQPDRHQRGGAEPGEDRPQLPDRRERADHRGQGNSRQFDGARRARQGGAPAHRGGDTRTALVGGALRRERAPLPQRARPPGRGGRAAMSRVFGTPLTDTAIRVVLLGSGELGKEVTIELQRLAVEVIAVDRYANAPAMQVAHRSHVIDMLDGKALRAVIGEERPDLVVPEIEAIHTQTLVELEREGLVVVPTARAARLTMDREGIRRLAAEELGLPTSQYRFVDTYGEYRAAIAGIGLPFVIKPVMSSS